MVKETRIAYEPADIVSLLVICNQCGGELRIRLGKKDRMLEVCPHCEARLKETGSRSVAEEILRLLLLMRNPPMSENYALRLETIEKDSE